MLSRERTEPQQRPALLDAAERAARPSLRQPWHAAAGLTFGRFAGCFAVLMAIVCAPLFLTPLPPLIDYPNHLARMYLLTNGVPAALQNSVFIRWAPLPNLAMDAVVPLLSLVLPLEWAGKLFIAITFGLLAGGTAALHRVLFGRWSLWPLLAFLLLYSKLLLWGWIGYLFGCGLALCAFAAWLALKERAWWVRVLTGCAFALGIYFSHMLAFGIYAVLIGCYELGEVWRSRRSLVAALRELAIGGLPFIPSLALLGTNASAGDIVYGSPLRKLYLLFGVFDNYSRPFDAACFAIAAGAVIFALSRRWIRLAPEIVVPALGLTAVYLAMPLQLFTAAGAEQRFPLVIFLLLIGGSAWLAEFSRRQVAFVAGAAILFAVRMGVIADIWHSAGRVYAELLPGLDTLPAGGCLAVGMSWDTVTPQPAPLVHFPTLAVIRRQAFVTTLFAYPTQQPIGLTPETQQMADVLLQDKLWNAFVDGDGTLSPAAVLALRQCGYVAFVGKEPFSLRNAGGLTPRYVTPRLQIYRVAAALSGP